MGKVKIGVFGAYRGKTMIGVLADHPDAELVAVCDKYEPLLEEVRDLAAAHNTEVACYTDFEEFFKEQTEKGYAVVFFTISSTMSATYHNACLAAEEFPGVQVVDTHVLDLSSLASCAQSINENLRRTGYAAQMYMVSRFYYLYGFLSRYEFDFLQHVYLICESKYSDI